MHDSKVCFKCEQIKPLTDFYKHPEMADGRLNKCKECNKKDTKENRLRNLDYYREYDRERTNLAHRVEARSKYRKTEKGLIAVNKARKKWVELNLIKRSATHIVNNAIRDGKLTKSNICEACNKENEIIHGHHDDYAYPMQVRWLCPKCHSDWHKKNGSGLNG